MQSYLEDSGLSYAKNQKIIRISGFVSFHQFLTITFFQVIEKTVWNWASQFLVGSVKIGKF